MVTLVMEARCVPMQSQSRDADELLLLADFSALSNAKALPVATALCAMLMLPKSNRSSMWLPALSLVSKVLPLEAARRRCRIS